MSIEERVKQRANELRKEKLGKQDVAKLSKEQKEVLRRASDKIIKKLEESSESLELLNPAQGHIIEAAALYKYNTNKHKVKTNYIRNFFIATFILAAILELI